MSSMAGGVNISQGFTTSNHQRTLHHEGNDEVHTTLREVERVKPDVFVLENVPGICAPFDAPGGSVNILDKVARKLLDLG